MYCLQNFYTRHDQVLTLLFKHLRKSENGNAKIEIFDGFSSSDNLLAVVNIRNNTRPQSVTTTGNNVFVRFTADARTEVFGTMTLLSSYGEDYLNAYCQECELRDLSEYRKYARFSTVISY